MNSRERVTRAIEMTGPDRVPITHATLPGAEKRYGQALEALYARFASDVVNVGAATHGEFGPEIGVPSRDTWGSEWVRYTDEHKGQVVGHPLADWSALDSFQPPDTAGDAIMAAVAENVERAEGYYRLADGDILWQRMFYLHGYAAMLEDLLLQPERSAALRDMILEVMRRRVARLCEIEGLDGVHFRDDWGTQEALMISPALWRDFFKPAYAELFGMVRQANKHVWFHSDGVIDAIIPDLIEIGVQVLNPQIDAMGKDRVAELCGGVICIQGDIDRQFALPYGTPDDVRQAVRDDVDAFGRHDGGYIGRGEAAGDVPLANLEAMFDEFVQYGTYE
jgi:hypothetical protein